MLSVTNREQNGSDPELAAQYPEPRLRHFTPCQCKQVERHLESSIRSALTSKGPNEIRKSTLRRLTSCHMIQLECSIFFWPSEPEL